MDPALARGSSELLALTGRCCRHRTDRRLRPAEKQRHDRAEGEEGAERNRLLPSGAALADDEGDPENRGSEQTEEEGGEDLPAERRAEEQRELHVAHPHPGRI